MEIIIPQWMKNIKEKIIVENFFKNKWRKHMYIKHPKDKALINIDKYVDIRCCPKNPTHIDFYEKPQAEDERGNPDYTIELATEKERDEYFEHLRDMLADEPYRHVQNVLEDKGETND